MGAKNSEVSTNPETIPLNGTRSRADAELGDEINTAAEQAKSSGIRTPAVALN